MFAGLELEGMIQSGKARQAKPAGAELCSDKYSYTRVYSSILAYVILEYEYLLEYSSTNTRVFSINRKKLKK